MEVVRSLTPSSQERTIYSLSQLGESLKRTLEKVTLDRALWFRAEIAKVSQSPTGHLYLELVEEHDGRRLASIKGTIWKAQLEVLRKELGDSAPQILTKGSAIVFSARVHYHAVYGVSLGIENIDLDAMIGEAERRKQQTLSTLKEQGALERNRNLPLPRLLRKIALVGSPGTSGFRDFGSHLVLNDVGLGFDVQVFSATVQGHDAPLSLIAAIASAEKWKPDVIVVVRGGGSALDLDAFNDLNLCLAIADAARPVLTGIGHETDLSVADLVAHLHFKTPTAVADFLIDRQSAEQHRLSEWSLSMQQLVQRRLHREREDWIAHQQLLRHQSLQIIAAQKTRLQNAQTHVSSWANHAFVRHEQRLSHLAQTVAALNPTNTLARGFAIARKSGVAVKRSSDLSANDVLELQFHQGAATVTVTSVNSTSHEPRSSS